MILPPSPATHSPRAALEMPLLSTVLKAFISAFSLTNLWVGQSIRPVHAVAFWANANFFPFNSWNFLIPKRE